MAELADALDLGSSGQPCGFESHYPYQKGLLQNENAIAVCTRLETDNENRSPGEAVQFTAFLGDRFLCIIFCEAIWQQSLFNAVNPVDSDSFYFLPL